MTPIRRRTALGLTAAAVASPAIARYGEPIYLDGRGHAIRGFDPVAYHTMDTAVPGALEFAFELDRAVWLFARETHLDRFRAEPERYIPQFGGYDAHGMALGFKRISDPTLWIEIDGKIYLHYSIAEQNRWATDILAHIEAAEDNWKDLRDL